MDPAVILIWAGLLSMAALPIVSIALVVEVRGSRARTHHLNVADRMIEALEVDLKDALSRRAPPRDDDRTPPSKMICQAGKAPCMFPDCECGVVPEPLPPNFSRREIAAPMRYFYLEKFADEIVPCEPTLEGWCRWLERGDVDWGADPAKDGDTFAGSALVMLEDIVAEPVMATPLSDEVPAWRLSREPEPGQFIAIREGPGLYWEFDDICEPTVAGIMAQLGPLAMDGPVHIAVGMHEEGWRFTFRTGPPAVLECEGRMQ